MHVPFLTKRAPKGGGGHGRGSSKGSTSKASKSKGKSAGFPGGTSVKVSPSSVGGGKPFTIDNGKPFAGRSMGGGYRGDVWGNSRYGSGYPGYYGVYGVRGRNFPFAFFPIVFFALLPIPVYYNIQTYAITEYGPPGNLDRPGGPLALTVFASKTSPNTKYSFLADTMTVTDVTPEVNKQCRDFVVPVDLKKQPPIPFTGDNPSQPLPEQAVQYYRSSSAVLLLDGYNNTAVFSSNDAPDTPLPDNIDRKLLECLNATIGVSIPIANGGSRTRTTSVFISFKFLLIVLFFKLLLSLC